MSEIKKSAPVDSVAKRMPDELSDEQLADVAGGACVYDRYTTATFNCTVCKHKTTFQRLHTVYSDGYIDHAGIAKPGSKGYSWWGCSECGTVWREKLRSGVFSTLQYRLFGPDWSKESWKSIDAAADFDPLWYPENY